MGSTSSACLFQSVLRPVQTHLMSFWMVRCYTYQRKVTLASMAAQVSSEIQACLTRSLGEGLRIWFLRSGKSLSDADASLRRMVQKGKWRAFCR